jgi:NNP family nitrate/nitrite transporter-like MFS transporter
MTVDVLSTTGAARRRPGGAPPGSTAAVLPGANGMLALASAGFFVNFWAWALLSPLGPTLKEELGLSSFQQALVVAVPVLVGSLGRVPVGALTDRLGARVMFPAVSFGTVLPVLLLARFHSYPALLAFGFLLGLAARRSRSGCRSSTPGSRRTAGGRRSGCSGWAWAAPRCPR